MSGFGTVNRLVSSWLTAFHENLAKKDYNAALTLLDESRLSADGLASVISEYGRKVVLPVEMELDAVEVLNGVANQWSVYTPIWTMEEGRSDLTLDLTVEVVGERLKVTLNDLHVL
jgi:hypothetical protein